MTRVFLDTTLPEKLRMASEPLELCDESGRVIGFFHPVPEPHAISQSPFSREQIEQRRQQKTGDPIDVVLKRLEDLANQDRP